MPKSKKTKEVKDSFIFEGTESILVSEELMEQRKKNAMEGSGYYLELGEE